MKGGLESPPDHSVLSPPPSIAKQRVLIKRQQRKSLMAKAYLEPSEIEQLENAATNLRDRLLIRILFHLGCRISEALALKVDDIDFKQGTVSIVQLKRRVKLSCAKCGARLGASHSFCPKCGAKTNGNA